jgi:hypothetical protein
LNPLNWQDTWHNSSSLLSLYQAMNVKFLSKGNNGLSMTGFEPMRPAILRLLVRRDNHSATPPLQVCFCTLPSNITWLCYVSQYLWQGFRTLNDNLISFLWPNIYCFVTVIYKRVTVNLGAHLGTKCQLLNALVSNKVTFNVSLWTPAAYSIIFVHVYLDILHHTRNI